MKKIVIGNDHAAVELKNIIFDYVKSLGYDIINVGYDGSDRCDYPDYAYKACKKIIDNEAELGILICGSGVGMSIAANKINGIRACCCSEPYSSKMSRIHNDANVICFGARVVGSELAKDIVKSFLDAEFAGDIHATRLLKIKNLESGK